MPVNTLSPLSVNLSKLDCHSKSVESWDFLNKKDPFDLCIGLGFFLVQLLKNECISHLVLLKVIYVSFQTFLVA